MKKIVMIIVFVFLASTSIAKTADPFSFQVVNEVQMAKDDIYSHALSWFAEKFVSSKHVIDLKDKEAGKIIGNGSVEVSLGWGVKSPCKFKIKVDIKDNKYRLTFSDVRVVFDNNDKPIEEANRKSLEPKVTKRFQEISEDLSNYLKTAKADNDW